MNKFAIALAVSLFTFNMNDAQAGITMSSNPVSGAVAGVEACTTNSINRTVNSTINSVASYAHSIEQSVEDIRNTDVPENIVDDIGTAFTTLGRSQESIIDNSISDINNMYGSISNALLGNMSALNSMSAALKNQDTYTGLVYDGEQEIRRMVQYDDLANEMERTLGLIPNAGQMDSNQANLGQTRNNVNRDAVEGVSSASRAIRNINRLGKLVDKLGGTGFTAEDLASSITDLEAINTLMNTDVSNLPADAMEKLPLSQYHMDLANFALTGMEQLNFIQNMIELITNANALQNIQDGVFETMELATNITTAVAAIQIIITVISADEFNAEDFKQAYRQARGAYKDVKENVANIQAARDALRRFANMVENLGQQLEQSVGQVQDIFGQSPDIISLLERLKELPQLQPIVEEYEEYLDVGDRAREYQQALLGFGTDAQSTDFILQGVEAAANSVMPTVDDIKQDLEQSITANIDIAAAEADIANGYQEVKKSENTFKELKRGARAFKSDIDEAKDNIRVVKEDLEEIGEAGTAFYNRLTAIEVSLDNLPTEQQLTDFATDGLGITETADSVLDAYQQISNFDAESYLTPIDDFIEDVDDIAQIEQYFSTYTDLINTLASSQQLLNGIQGNMQDMGGLLSCFDINIQAMVEDLLMRSKDQIFYGLKTGIWKAYGEATGGIPYMMLPKHHKKFESKFDLPDMQEEEDRGTHNFHAKEDEMMMADSNNYIDKATSFYTPVNVEPSRDHLYELAGVTQEAEEPPHALAGLQFAQANNTQPNIRRVAPRTRADYLNPELMDDPLQVRRTRMEREMEYDHTMSAWDFDMPNAPEVAMDGVTMDHGDFVAHSWTDFAFKCGGDIEDKFCWHWSWITIWFIKFKAAYTMPACETQLTYKEPTVHVEVSPRATQSLISNLDWLKDIPSNVDDWTAGARDPIPSAHVFGISPVARYTSNLTPFFANHTMACDLAPKWDKFEFIQLYKIPLPSVKLAMKMGFAIQEMSEWNNEWFRDDVPLVGIFPAPLAILYATELHKPYWNPRLMVTGQTPTGESFPDYDVSRTESYKWAMPYAANVASDPTGTIVVGTMYQNKCDAGYPSDGTNTCIGEQRTGWGALFPRNGQVQTIDHRLPLKSYAQIAWRAYDRMLEGSLETNYLGYVDDDAEKVVNISALKIDTGTAHYGIGPEETEFSLEWPYRTPRYPVGENPENWQKGYFGENIKSGGMIMTLWRDTTCCVMACCGYPGINVHPGETWYSEDALQIFETKEWWITDVRKHNPNTINVVSSDTIPSDDYVEPNPDGSSADYDECIAGGDSDRRCLGRVAGVFDDEACVDYGLSSIFCDIVFDVNITSSTICQETVSDRLADENGVGRMCSARPYHTGGCRNYCIVNVCDDSPDGNCVDTCMDNQCEPMCDAMLYPEAICDSVHY